MAYWTTSEEEHPVYHYYYDCPEGAKIKEKNRDGGEPPADREMCELCAARLHPTR